jgi:hypothetical protein
MWKTVLSCATAGVLINLPFTAQAANLSEAQIKSQIVDKTFAWSNPKDKSAGTVAFKSDGTSSVSIANNPKLSQDSGQYSIKGSKICVKWQVVMSAKMSCFALFESGPGHFRTSDGFDWTSQ